ncbi:MAG: DinB family protein [Bacteroidota bacterium]|nr:DinB family protein [Bacteroidota bacterium]
MSRPSISSYSSHFATYVSLVNDDDINNALKTQTPEVEKFLNSITEEQSLHRYAEGKWTLKEVLQHLIDAERVFAYRAMAIARRDKNSLPSFDENSYAHNSHANQRSWQELLAEFVTLRKTTEILFNSFTEEDLNSSGIASNNPITTNALGYVTVGHMSHHINIIKERYL